MKVRLKVKILFSEAISYVAYVKTDFADILQIFRLNWSISIAKGGFRDSLVLPYTYIFFIIHYILFV